MKLGKYKMEKEIKQNAYREKVNNIKNNSEPKKVNSYSEWMKKSFRF